MAENEEEIRLAFLPAAPEEAALAAATVYFNRMDPEHNYRLVIQEEDGLQFAGIIKQVVDGDEIKDAAAVDLEPLTRLEHIRELWEIEDFVRCALEGREYHPEPLEEED